MPKLRHIAIAAEDPEAMAEFYKKAFDFIEVVRPNGVLVEDVDAFSKKLESLGAEHYIDQGHGGNQAGYFEKKFYGPEHVLFDIAEHGWAGAEPLPEPVKEAAE